MKKIITIFTLSSIVILLQAEAIETRSLCVDETLKKILKTESSKKERPVIFNQSADDEELHLLMQQIVLKKNRLIKIEPKDEKNFFNNLLKIGYSFKNPRKLKRLFFLKLLIKAFQRRFRQEIINGKIDKECLLISENIAKKFK